MKIFHAGNFPQMSTVKSEKAMARKVLASGSDYNRLVSFSFPEHNENVIEAVKELREEAEGEGDD